MLVMIDEISFFEYRDKLARYAARFVFPHEIDDVLSRTFIKVNGRSCNQIENYLLKAVKNTCLTTIEKRRSDGRRDGLVASGKTLEDTDNSLSKLSTQEEIDKCHELLSGRPKLQQLFKLMMNGLTISELAHATGKSPDTLRKDRSRIRRLLRNGFLNSMEL